MNTAQTAGKIASKKSHKKEVYLLLHNIRSAHNVGSIFRTADAAGVSKIFLSGYSPRPIDRFGRPVKELVKVALGGEQSVAWEDVTNPMKLIASHKAKGVIVIGIEQDKRSQDYKKIQTINPVLFIVGNEVRGMSKSLRNACDILAEIPMNGTKESLNVGVSLGIALFRILNI